MIFGAAMHSPTNKNKRVSKGIAVAAVSLGLLSMLGGCVAPAVAPPVAAPVAVPPPAPTELTEEAQAALTAAEQSVIEARVKRSLWTSAVEHLEKARAAAKIFDSNATLLHAREVVALCARSIEQLKLPPVTW